MNAREIFIVARYEFLVISRGVVFRVLTLLALFATNLLVKVRNSASRI